jgi:hypothetical protein
MLMALLRAPFSVALIRTEFRVVVQPFLTPQALLTRQPRAAQSSQRSPCQSHRASCAFASQTGPVPCATTSCSPPAKP